MKREDRRVDRTRALLQQALMELIREKGYDAVTIQDITDRANVGRATFYLHYPSKDALFLSGHLKDMDYPYYGVLTKEELLDRNPPRSLVEIFRFVKGNRLLISVIGHSKDASIITKQIKEQQAEQIEQSLKLAFPEESQTVDLLMLSSYLAMSQLNLMTWWLENHAPQSPEEIASICHRFQRAAICEAFQLPLDIAL